MWIIHPSSSKVGIPDDALTDQRKIVESLCWDKVLLAGAKNLEYRTYASTVYLPKSPFLKFSLDEKIHRASEVWRYYAP